MSFAERTAHGDVQQSPGWTRAPVDLLLVVLFGLIGLVLAVISSVLFRVAAALFGWRS